MTHWISCTPPAVRWHRDNAHQFGWEWLDAKDYPEWLLRQPNEVGALVENTATKTTIQRRIKQP